MRFDRLKSLLEREIKANISLQGNKYVEKLNKLRIAKGEKFKDKHVLVVGGGISGLCSAYELKKLGFKVTILEAQSNHLGGRVRTYRKNDGTYGELGAMRIPKGHLLTRQYINEFGLNLRKFVQDSNDTYAYVRNKRFTRAKRDIEKVRPLFNLTQEEQNLTPDDMWTKAVLSVLNNLSEKELEDLFSIDPTTDRLKQLDQLSLSNALHQTGLSEEAIEFVTTFYGVETYMSTGLTEHLREEKEEVWINGFDEIVGGMDLLPSSFAKKLEREIITSAPVFKIEQDNKEIVAYYKNQEGEIQSVCGDWLICTIPLGVLNRINLTPCISPQKIRAMRRVNYDSSTKILAHCGKRFWELEDKIYGGGTIWDGGLGHTWYPSDNSKEKNKNISNSPAILLTSYTWGQHARRIDSIPHKELKNYVIKELLKIHPNFDKELINQIIPWSWTNFPWSSGAFAFFNPGEHTSLYQDLKSPEGKFLLAGEHCSLTHSWIQGAMESAIDSCEFIIKNEGFDL